ncbi:hypothetical protein CVT25_001617 [Psilocybe cyanescens]|uniref:F-box domain-containing protein n=1 Tax=Psilocybe cyanescens TaxID=93625 RepID=A0A409WQ21_PSICY|nr:hypothetical protein CVT25_001617 [Psilocybe cyanescens]
MTRRKVSTRSTLVDDISTRPLIHEKLPPELMAVIFESYVSCFLANLLAKWSYEQTEKPKNNICLPLLLGAVCQTWRSIAWSSPQLWGFIVIKPRRLDDLLSVEVAEECLSRSGQLPLKIIIVFSNNPDNGQAAISNPKSVLGRLASVVNGHSHQWEYLHLICPPALFPLFSGGPQGAPIIDRLLLTTADYDFDFHGFDNPPFTMTGAESRPSFIHTTHFWFKSIKINWSNITKAIIVDKIRLDDLIELLRQAPQLVICIISGFGDLDPTDQFSLDNLPIVHHELQQLHFGGYYEGHDLEWFFDSLILPGLKTLRLYNMPYHSILANIEALVCRSSCRLRDLTLSVVRYTYEELIRLLQKNPFLNELELQSCVIDIRELLVLLEDTSFLQTSNRILEEAFLPELNSVMITKDDSIIWDDSLYALILDLIKTSPNEPDSQSGRRPLHQVDIKSPGSESSETPVCFNKDVVQSLFDLSTSRSFIIDLSQGGVDLLEHSAKHWGIWRPRE